MRVVLFYLEINFQSLALNGRSTTIEAIAVVPRAVR